MQKRAYLGLGFLLALGILVLGAFTGGTALAQTAGPPAVFTVPATGGSGSIPGGGSLTFAPGAVPAGSTATVTPLAAPPPGTTLPGVGNVYDFRVVGPNGEPITSFAGRVTITGTGNTCLILNEATGRFEPLQGTPIGGGQIECVIPRPGIIAIVTVLGAQATPTVRPAATPAGAGAARPPTQAPGQAPGQGPGKAGAAPGQAPGKAGAAPAQAPGKAGAAPAQAPGKAGAAPAQAPSALPRTGEEFPVGALALAGLTLAGIGVATRRFIRRK